MPAETTMACPECGGLGQTMDRGILLPSCDECEGTGRVPAALALPFAAYVNTDPDVEYVADLLPIPKENRHDC